MGCDFSILVKQEFTEKITELENYEKRIEKKQKTIKRMLNEFNDITTPEFEINIISNNLCSQLITLERMVEEIGIAKNNESNSSDLSISKSVENIKEIDTLPPIGKSNKSLLKNHINASSSKEKSLKHAVKLNTAESILEDPEIMALISKNRDKFLKKLTK